MARRRKNFLAISLLIGSITLFALRGIAQVQVCALPITNATLTSHGFVVMDGQKRLRIQLENRDGQSLDGHIGPDDPLFEAVYISTLKAAQNPDAVGIDMALISESIHEICTIDFHAPVPTPTPTPVQCSSNFCSENFFLPGTTVCDGPSRVTCEEDANGCVIEAQRIACTNGCNQGSCIAQP